MYGTVAKLKVKPGKLEELQKVTQARGVQIPGILFEHVFQTDADPESLYLVVAFESKEAYRKNAESPDQHQEYLSYRALLAEDPEWHDGAVVQSQTYS